MTDAPGAPGAARSRRGRLLALMKSLPETTADPAGDEVRHLSLAVRGRRFGWYLDDHHGHGEIALTCRAPAGVNDELVAHGPGRFFIPAYTGPRGWIGLRLDLESVDWDEVEHLLVDAYRMTAPKNLVALLSGNEHD